MSQNLNALISLYDKEKGKNPEWDKDTLSAIEAGMSKFNEGQINQDRGASAGVRAQVGAAQSPEDRLATMRNFYPEAIPYGEDNFLAINRRNDQPFLYNPPGMDLGDIPEYMRDIVTTGAGIGGATLAAPAVATGAGAPAPVIAGGLASAGAGYLYDQGMEYFGDTVDTRTLGEQIEDYSLETALGMLPVDKLGAPISNFFRDRIIDPSKNAVREVVEKYDIEATAGTVGDGLLKSLEAGSQRMGAAMNNFQEAADRMYVGIEGMIDNLYTSMGGRTSSIDAGRSVIESGQAFIEKHTKQSDAMYDAVDAFIDPSDFILPSNLKGAAQEMMFASDLGKLFQKDLAANIVKTIDSEGPIPYSELAKIRSALGKTIGEKSQVGPGDIGLAEAKKLYEAITLDMQEMAKRQGDEALAAWEAANDFYRVGKKTTDEVIYPTMTTRGGKEWLPPEDVQRRMAGLAARDPDGLAKMQTSGVLSQDDMGRVGAGILDDLGQGTPGSAAVIEDRLSPARIPAQTSSKVIHEESKDVLFNMTSREILEDLRVLGGAVKQTDELVNRSGTGNMNVISGALSAAGTAIATQDPATIGAAVLATYVLPYLGSKGLQSKPFINWVTKGSKSGTGKEWVRAGARMAAKEGLLELYDAVIEFESGNTGATEEIRGMLFE